MDKYAPVRERTIILRPHAPWYSEELHEAKRKRRQYERRWRKTGLEIHRQIYRAQCNTVGRLLLDTRTGYYQAKLEACGQDQKAIYNIANHLLGRN